MVTRDKMKRSLLLVCCLLTAIGAFGITRKIPLTLRSMSLRWRGLRPESLPQLRRRAFRFKSFQTLVPYVEIDLRSNERLPLQSIQVGPIGDQELLAHAAMLLLESKGYENAAELIHASSYRLR